MKTGENGIISVNLYKICHFSTCKGPRVGKETCLESPSYITTFQQWSNCSP